MVRVGCLLLQCVFAVASCEVVSETAGLALIQTTVNAIAGNAENSYIAQDYKWTEFKFKYSSGYAAGVKRRFQSLSDAQAECLELGVDYCQAVTCNKRAECTLRASSVLSNSPFGESTYLAEGAGSATSCKTEAGGCSIYDDQHVVAFDSAKMSLLEEPGQLPDMNEHLIKLMTKESSGDVWLVKSSTVKIQARYSPDDGHPNKVQVRTIAVGGPFLNGSMLVIEPLNGKMTYDGIEILTEAESEFVADSAINARRHNFSCLVQDMTQRIPGIDVQLPRGVKLTVNRQPHHVNVHISMRRLAGGQDGLCGNNNGDASDDHVEQIMARRPPTVAYGESLLPSISKNVFSSVYSYFTAPKEGPQAGDVDSCSENVGCSVYDDQNVVLFDGAKISDVNDKLVKLMSRESSGDMWLVKSRPVNIQARYGSDADHPNKMKVRSLAVGGAFLNGAQLVIEPLNGKITWDGTEILPDDQSEFLLNGVINARRHDLSCLVEDMTRRSPGIDVNLPKGVKLTINRQPNHVNVHITMPHMAGQKGLCGNNNGDSADDQVELLIEKHAPIVASAESLLPPVSNSIMLKNLYNYLTNSN